MAVTWGTPMPSTSRVVQAAPGPTPTKMAAMPCSISAAAASYEVVLPTATGMPMSLRELAELQRLVARGEVLRGRDLRLHQEDVGAVLGAERAPATGRGRAWPR